MVAVNLEQFNMTTYKSSNVNIKQVNIHTLLSLTFSSVHCLKQIFSHAVYEFGCLTIPYKRRKLTTINILKPD